MLRAMIKYVTQPLGSALCGQTCVAMIAGISLEESIDVFGKRGETETRDLVAALRKLNIRCGDKLIRRKKGRDLPECCIVVVHFPGAPMRHWHWVVYYKGLYYDPDTGIGMLYRPEVRITSYLPIYLEQEEI